MNQELSEQARQIDSPNRPAPKPIQFSAAPTQAPIEFSMSDFTLTDSNNLTAKRKAEAMESLSRRIEAPQEEFYDMDEHLDKGLQTGMNQYYNRAENQTAGEKLWTGLKNFAAEATIGTAESTALLLDFKMHLDSFRGIETEFENEVSKYFREWKEDVQEGNKVYVRKGNEGFSPGSVDFWADNMNTVASTLTLMLPSTAAAKVLTAGVKGMAKAMRINKMAVMARNAKALKNTVAGVNAAVLSRLGENAMEAGETAKGLAEELRSVMVTNPDGTESPKYSEEEIRQLAGEAGRDVWNKNWVMLSQDIWQYTTGFKAFNYARRGAKDAVQKGLWKQLANAGKEVGKFAISDMGAEGLEEGYQYIVSEEAKYDVKRKLDLVEESSHWERFANYVDDDEFKTSVLMGAVGGGIFSGIHRVNDMRKERKERRQRQEMAEQFKAQYETLFGSEEGFVKATDDAFITAAINKAETGHIDTMEADLQMLLNESDESLIERGVEDPKAYREKVVRAQKLLKVSEEEYNRTMNDSSIMPELRRATVFNRMYIHHAENRTMENTKKLNDLYSKDLTLFEVKEKATAQKLLEYKKAYIEGRDAEAAALAKEIMAESKLYTSEAKLKEAISTANDPGILSLAMFMELEQENLKEAKEFEEKLKTPQGQAELFRKAKAEAEKQAKKAKEKAEAKKAEEEAEEEGGKSLTDLTDEEIDKHATLSKEQKEYTKGRNAATAKYGAEELKEADGTKVFTTSSKGKDGHIRTWAKGETVKDGKGNKWKVTNPVKGNSGVYLVRVDKAKAGEPTEATSFEVEEKYGKLSHETEKPWKPGVWTVNKTQFQNTKKIKAEQEAEARKAERIIKGIVLTMGSEFENYSPKVENGVIVRDKTGFMVMQFDGAPKLREDSHIKVDYERAAQPMQKEETVGGDVLHIEEDATLRVEDTPDGEVIVVEQESEGGGKSVVSIVTSDSLGQEVFQNLVDHISDKGGSISAKVIGKQASFSGNLGTVAGQKASLNVMRGSKFLPDGKIYLGSRKHTTSESKSIVFYPEDGSAPIEYYLTDDQINSGAYKGHTYMLMLSPNGDLVPIQLNEGRLGELMVTDSSGRQIDMATKVYEDLERERDILQAEMEAAIEAEVASGSARSTAIGKITKEYGFSGGKKGKKKKTEEESGAKAETRLEAILSKYVEPYARRVRQQVTEVNGRKVYTTTQNFFNVKFSLVYEKDGKKLSVPEIRIDVADAVPNPKVEGTWISSTAALREQAIDKLRNRFFTMSLDEMAGEDGPAYIHQAIVGNRVTTDLYASRPWVNTRLRLQLDAEGTAAIKQGVKKPKKSTTKKTETSGKTSKIEQVNEATVNTIRDEKRTAARRAANGLSDKRETTTTRGKEYPLSQLHKEHLEDIIEFEEFEKAVNEAFEYGLANNVNDNKPTAIWGAAAKKVIDEVFANATAEQLGITPAESGTEEQTKLNEAAKTTKEKDKEKKIAQPIQSSESNLVFGTKSDAYNAMVDSVPKGIWQSKDGSITVSEEGAGGEVAIYRPTTSRGKVDKKFSDAINKLKGDRVFRVQADDTVLIAELEKAGATFKTYSVSDTKTKTKPEGTKKPAPTTSKYRSPEITKGKIGDVTVNSVDEFRSDITVPEISEVGESGNKSIQVEGETSGAPEVTLFRESNHNITKGMKTEIEKLRMKDTMTLFRVLGTDTHMVSHLEKMGYRYEVYNIGTPENTKKASKPEVKQENKTTIKEPTPQPTVKGVGNLGNMRGIKPIGKKRVDNNPNPTPSKVGERNNNGATTPESSEDIMNKVRNGDLSTNVSGIPEMTAENSEKGLYEKVQSGEIEMKDCTFLSGKWTHIPY